jgi:hypothetical protein
MRTGAALLLAVTLFAPCVRATTNNDDSCDIGVYPAATLLLPYFEVETAIRGTDTFFTVTNVSHVPQIARVTIWTDWAFPVLTFNLFLTGYDVQSISMYDVIVNGIIAPGTGGTSSTIAPGKLSAANGANPNLSVSGCDQLPGVIAEPLRSAVRSALVVGIYHAPQFGSTCGSTFVGSFAATHTTPTTAVGYITIDVTSRCASTNPADPAYYVSDILFDNVLTGDYQILDKSVGHNFAGGSPLVHIRAIPEGGPAGVPMSGAQTRLPYTFYARYVNGSTLFTGSHINADRRQPLPSTFAARWIEGGPSGFSTSFRIWREGMTGPRTNAAAGVTPTTCASVQKNSSLDLADAVRFDEHENSAVLAYIGRDGNCPSLCIPTNYATPAVSTKSPSALVFPPQSFVTADTAGWMYLNLHSGLTHYTLVQQDLLPRPSQNWVVVSMSSAGALSVDFDATALGNGCSPAKLESIATLPNGPRIGPAGNTNP